MIAMFVLVSVMLVPYTSEHLVNAHLQVLMTFVTLLLVFCDP